MSSTTIGEWWVTTGRQAAYGPWSPTIDRTERDRQLRCMAGSARMLLGPHHELPGLLRQTESDDAAFVRAGEIVERLPALTRRRLLGAFSAVTWPQQPRREGK